MSPTAAADFTAKSIAEAKSLIGVYLRRELHNRTATRTAIINWARAVGERNPLWMDETYARASRYGSIIAPPCWLYSVDDTLVAPKFAGMHSIYAGTDWEFFHPVRVEDEISVTARLLDVIEKNGRFCGRMFLQVGEVVYTNNRGQKVARAISKVMRTSREAAVAKQKYAGITKHQYNLDEIHAVEKGYDAEQIKGREPRYWDDVKVGDELPEIVKGPLTNEEVRQFLNSTKPAPSFAGFLEYRLRHPAAAFRDPETNMWDDWMDSMLEDKVARRFGFPAAHDVGIDRISWLASLVTNWIGDDGFMRKMGAELILPDIYADTTWCKGRVTRKYEQDGEHFVDCEIWCENQRQEKTTANGHATAVLPGKSVK